MHTTQIIWFLSLPLTIYISYLAVRWIIRKYEKRFPDVARDDTKIPSK